MEDEMTENEITSIDEQSLREEKRAYFFKQVDQLFAQTSEGYYYKSNNDGLYKGPYHNYHQCVHNNIKELQQIKLKGG